MDTSTIFIIAIVVGLILGIIYIISISISKKKMDVGLSRLKDFNPSQKFIGENAETGIAIDEKRKKLCLIKNQGGNISFRVFPYKDVFESEIFEDGFTITKTSRGSQIGSAILGGLIAGGVGAIIGGLSGKKKSSEKVERIDLRIIVNDTKEPTHIVNFMGTKCKKEGIIYKTSLEEARHWHDVISVLMKEADREDKEREKQSQLNNKQPSLSVADELLKLSNLLEKGIITEEEFSSQKAKLLSVK